MSTRPVAAMTDAVARQIVREYNGNAGSIAVALADEVLARGGWKANTCKPLLRAYEIAAVAPRPPDPPCRHQHHVSLSSGGSMGQRTSDGSGWEPCPAVPHTGKPVVDQLTGNAAVEAAFHAQPRSNFSLNSDEVRVMLRAVADVLGRLG